MVTKAELLERLENLSKRSSMTVEEYRKLMERSKFVCPLNRDITSCDTRDCPSVGLYCEMGPCPWGLNREGCGSHFGGLAGCVADHSDECLSARLARAELRRLMEVSRRGR